MTKNKISSCTNKNKHRFNIVVVIPRSGGSRRYKIIETRNFEIALKEQIKFKEELKVHGYHRRTMEKTVSKTSIGELAAEYLDCISGAGAYSFMNMKRSPDSLG